MKASKIIFALTSLLFISSFSTLKAIEEEDPIIIMTNSVVEEDPIIIMTNNIIDEDPIIIMTGE